MTINCPNTFFSVDNCRAFRYNHGIYNLYEFAQSSFHNGDLYVKKDSVTSLYLAMEWIGVKMAKMDVLDCLFFVAEGEDGQESSGVPETP